MILIGFSGRARSGKDTAMKAMGVAADGHDFKKRTYSFSEEILLFCQGQGKLPIHLKREDLNKEQLDVIVAVSYDMRWCFGEDYWVRRVDVRIKQDKPDVAFIPNLRTGHELLWFKGLGGYHVRVERVNADGSPHIALDRDPNDPLETALLNAPADFYIKAGSGQVDLVRAQAVTIFNFIRSDYANRTAAVSRTAN